MANAQPVPRPFLKWVGGKRQLLPQILAAMPPEFDRYHEPFVGGGALLFESGRTGRLDYKALGQKRVYLSDKNEELIQTYRAVRDQVEDVIPLLKELRYDEKLFYKIRSLDPERLQPASLAARMIFLNRTCFNGLYRVNSKGKFNTPFGSYTNPVICDEKNLRYASHLLSGMKIQTKPFASVLDDVRAGSFVYMDPPYMPVSATANFTNFTRDGFSLEQNEELFRVFEECVERGAFVLLSNADTEWAAKRYRHCRLIKVSARRSVNANAAKRGPVSELLIASYSEAL